MDHPTKVKGQCVSMLIDEEGLLKEVIIPNLIGSYLYETDKHNIPITGNILIVGEEWTGDGIDFCGIEESVFKILELQLNNMIMAMKARDEQNELIQKLDLAVSFCKSERMGIYDIAKLT